MPEILARRNRAAAKCHTCDYCGEVIQEGEVYDWTKLTYDGRIYEWKAHKKCASIATDLWDYADPDEGMTEDIFQEACADFCSAFVCADYPSFSREMKDCEKGKAFCTDRIYSLLKTHDFHRDSEKRWVWRCEPKEKGEE